MNEKSNLVILFILDCVRKDHLSTYNYLRNTSKNISKLGKHAKIYNYAIAPSSNTISSIPSILTGKYPLDLSNKFTGKKFSEKDFNLFNKLKKIGYKTAMFTANYITSRNYINIHTHFDYFWDELSLKELNRDKYYQSGNKVIKSAKNYIFKNKSKKLFVVIHLMEAHGPYVPTYNSIFKNDIIFNKDKRKIKKTSDFVYQTRTDVNKAYAPIYSLLKLKISKKGKLSYEKDINKYIAQYDMGIYLMDKLIGNFISYLKTNNLYNKSKIIITSDHGELLGEDNLFFTHGTYTHPALVNVPLIIKEPFQKKSEIINDNYSLINLIRSITNSKKVKIVLSMHPKSLGRLYENNYKFIHIGNFNNKVDILGESLLFDIYKTDSDFSIKKLPFNNYIYEYYFKKKLDNLTFIKTKKIITKKSYDIKKIIRKYLI